MEGRSDPTKSSFLLGDGYYKVKSLSAGPIASLLSTGELLSCSNMLWVV